MNYEKIRQKLEERRAVLLARLQVGVGEGQANQPINPDRADLAQSYAMKDRDSALFEQMEGNLEKIEETLQRLDDGTYGKCVRCGRDIAIERLEVLPYVDLCIRCQRLEERNNG